MTCWVQPNHNSITKTITPQSPSSKLTLLLRCALYTVHIENYSRYICKPITINRYLFAVSDSRASTFCRLIPPCRQILMSMALRAIIIVNTHRRTLLRRLWIDDYVAGWFTVHRWTAIALHGHWWSWSKTATHKMAPDALFNGSFTVRRGVSCHAIILLFFCLPSDFPIWILRRSLAVQLLQALFYFPCSSTTTTQNW